MNKSKKGIIISVIALVAVLAIACAGIFLLTDKPTEGAKTIGFTVVDNNKVSKEYTLHTDEEFLAGALLEAGIITKYAEDGYYTTIQGVTADWSVDQSWWCITKDGEMTNYGLNELVIKDGDHFEATYTIG